MSVMRRVLNICRAGPWTNRNLLYTSSNQIKPQFPQSCRLISGNSLENVISSRKAEAKRSIVVQVNSEGSYSELYAYCSQFGKIVDIHHYSIQNNQHFMLIEFCDENGVKALLSNGHFINDPEVIPTRSSFMWFRSTSSKSVLTPLQGSGMFPVDKKLVCVNGCAIPDSSKISSRLIEASSISNQIETLYKMTHLNDIGTRLRFMVSRQIECILNGLFPDICVSPFGSSVNGFGKLGCDLDLILKLSQDVSNDNNDSRLVFHTKKSLNTGRLQQQKHMEVIGDIIQIFLPGCSQIRRILQARIPIIKFNQDYAGIECDLSMGSMSGLYMSELLYLFGSIDERVKPLIFTIKKWAQSVGITNPSPGRWITNFPLTLMVIFFLQNAKDGAILPTLNYLKSSARKEDYRLTDDNVECTFLRDISELSFKSENNASLESLLTEFFEFYSAFDFGDQAMSINEGKIVRKLDHAPLYIVNPLEISLNVSKNVSYEECERLQVEMKNAVWHLDTIVDRKSPNWGLVGLFKFNEPSLRNVVKEARNHRLVSVKDLFDDTDKSDNTPKDTNINLTFDVRKSANITGMYYKNDNIKKEIEQMHKSNNDDLKRHLRYYTTMKNDNKPVIKRKTRRR